MDVAQDADPGRERRSAVWLGQPSLETWGLRHTPSSTVPSLLPAATEGDGNSLLLAEGNCNFSIADSRNRQFMWGRA